MSNRLQDGKFRIFYLGCAQFSRSSCVPNLIIDEIVTNFENLIRSTHNCRSNGPSGFSSHVLNEKISLLVPEYARHRSYNYDRDGKKNKNVLILRKVNLTSSGYYANSDYPQIASVRYFLNVANEELRIVDADDDEYEDGEEIRKFANPNPLIVIKLKDIISCSQGIKNPSYIGLVTPGSSPSLTTHLQSSSSLPAHVSNGSSTSGMVLNCHLLKCDSESEVLEIMRSLKNALQLLAAPPPPSSSSPTSSLSSSAQPPPSSSSSSLFSSSSVTRPAFNNYIHNYKDITDNNYNSNDNVLFNAVLSNNAAIERLNTLCKEIQNRSFADAHVMLQLFIERFHPEEQSNILKKIQEAGCETLQEANEVIVSCLLRLVENKSRSNVSTSLLGVTKISSSSSAASSSSSFTACVNSSLSSLSSSLSVQLLTTSSSSSSSAATASLPVPPRPSSSLQLSSPTSPSSSGSHHHQQQQQHHPTQQHHHLLYSQQQHHDQQQNRYHNQDQQYSENLNIRSMFMSVGNQPERKKKSPTTSTTSLTATTTTTSSTTTAFVTSLATSPKTSPTTLLTNNRNDKSLDQSVRQVIQQRHEQQQQQQSNDLVDSWRLGLLSKVVTTSKASLSGVNYPRYLKELRHQTPVKKMNHLWRKAIADTLYLVKINKKNHKNNNYDNNFDKRRHSRSHSLHTEDDDDEEQCIKQVRPLKVNYDEITPCLRRVSVVWDRMLKRHYHQLNNNNNNNGNSNNNSSINNDNDNSGIINNNDDDDNSDNKLNNEECFCGVNDNNDDDGGDKSSSHRSESGSVNGCNTGNNDDDDGGDDDDDGDGLKDDNFISGDVKHRSDDDDDDDDDDDSNLNNDDDDDEDDDDVSHVYTWAHIVETVRAGVPRKRRGQIWLYLIHQWKHLGCHQQHNCSNDDDDSTAANKKSDECEKSGDSDELEGRPYREILKNWSTHQHAILIDLGRTFPGHPLFSTQLGAGQIALFNILKAYSLIDAQVGYCQGISFVAGVLLMHAPEELSFKLLKHLMFDLGLRKQYEMDMIHLQIKLYQLSRLVHDLHRDLFEHLEGLEINPTLYAASWFLTVFSSQFPLGFVARVFDLIFLQGIDVITKVALVLLGNHKELIKQCQGFEGTVDFLKTTLPEMGIIQMERIINQVFDMDISRQLQSYKSEYYLLKDEMMTLKCNSSTDAASKNVVAKNTSTPATITAMSSTNNSSITITTFSTTAEQQRVSPSETSATTTLAPATTTLTSATTTTEQQRLQQLSTYCIILEDFLNSAQPCLSEELRSDLNKIFKKKPKFLLNQ